MALRNSMSGIEVQLIKHLSEIPAVVTSHGVGEKKVLLANADTLTNITQIAVTRLMAGEIAASHSHPDMEEWFLVKKGDIDFIIDGVTYHCHKDDFITIPIGFMHELHAASDSEIVTIGCQL
jgi:quercetin dioxygenase-like cupin family protein